jgi:hypothetical protein
MKRTASEIIRNLEIRIARLERQSSNKTAKVTSSDLKMWFYPRPKRVKVVTQSGSKLTLKDVKNMTNVNLYVYGVYNDGSEDSMLLVHIDGEGRLQKGWDGGFNLDG